MEELVEPVRSAEHGQSASTASASRCGFNKTVFIKAQLYGQFHLFGIFFLKDLHTFFFFFFSPKVVINNFKFGGEKNN